MKRVFVVLLVCILIFGQLFACGKDEEQSEIITMTMNRTTITLSTNSGEQLSVTVSNPSVEITWSSSDESVATVSESGYVSALKMGEVIISASCGEVNATCKVSVVGAEYTPILENVQDEISLFVNKEFKILPKLTYGGKEVENATYVYSSENPEIATVTDGVIKGIKAGKTTVSVSSSRENETVNKNITVKVLEKEFFFIEQDSVKLAKNSLNSGDVSQYQLTTVAIDKDTKIDSASVTWESENENVVIVDNGGKVTAVDKGVANVIATLNYKGKTIKAWTAVEVYKSVIDITNEITGVEINSDNTLKLPTSSFAYTGVNNEKTVLKVGGKTFDGVISDGFAVINTDGELYGKHEILLEVNDREFSANADIIAKLIEYKVNRYFYNANTKEYVKQGVTATESVRFDANLIEYFLVNGTYMLNSVKTGGFSINADGTSVFDLFYDQAIPIANSENKAALYYMTEKDDLGSDKVAIESVGTYKNKSNVYKVTDIARRTYLKIVGIDAEYLKSKGYTKFKFNVYFGTSATNVVTSIANDVYPSGKLLSLHVASEIAAQSDRIKVYNMSGVEISNVLDAQWATVEFDLNKVVSDSNGIKSVSVILGCEAMSSFYIQDAKFI